METITKKQQGKYFRFQISFPGRFSHFSVYDSSGFCSSDSAHLQFFNPGTTSKKNLFEKAKFLNTISRGKITKKIVNKSLEYHGECRGSNTSNLQGPSILSSYPMGDVHPFATLP